MSSLAVNPTLPYPVMSETPIFIVKGGTSSLYIFEHGVEVRSMGLFMSNAYEIRYDQIAQISIKRGLRTTLAIESRGGQITSVKTPYFWQADKGREIMQERMNRALDTTSEGATSSTQSLAAQIRELAELKEAGIISEAEFESKKTQLLDRM
jgi:hypothetical protein